LALTGRLIAHEISRYLGVVAGISGFWPVAAPYASIGTNAATKATVCEYAIGFVAATGDVRSGLPFRLSLKKIIRRNAASATEASRSH